MIETPRLVLRRWRDADRAPFIAMSADPAVMDWLGGTRTAEQSEATIDRIESAFDRLGHGFFAIERKADGAFLGFAGLAPVHEREPIPEGVEIGWRLIRAAWGAGYATEAARAALDDGFTRLALPEVVAFTARTNLRSQAVMQRLGMTRDAARDFDHPALAQDHPLRPHVVYFARSSAAPSARS